MLVYPEQSTARQLPLESSVLVSSQEWGHYPAYHLRIVHRMVHILHRHGHSDEDHEIQCTGGMACHKEINNYQCEVTQMVEWSTKWECHTHNTYRVLIGYSKVTMSYIRQLYSGITCGRVLTPKVLVTAIDAQWEGMGDVGLARYELALLPPCPTIRVLSYSTVTSKFQKFSTLRVNMSQKERATSCIISFFKGI